jgi:hypothetical protein
MRRAPKQNLNIDWNRTYNTKQVCKIFRVSPRNLQYWSEQKILNPKLDDKKTAGGTIRSFGMRDLILVGVMVALKKKGLGLRKLRKIVALIQLDIFILLAGMKVPAAVKTTKTGNLIERHGVKVTIRKRLPHATRITTLRVPLRDILNRIERGRP